MTDISIVESFFLCAVQGKGKIFGDDYSKIACLLSAVFEEMIKAGLVEIGAGKLHVARQQEIPADCRPYLTPVFNHLKEVESLELKHIMQDYNSGWSDRHLNALTTAIGTGLADSGFATKAKLGLFNSRVYFMPCKTVIPSLSAELLVNLLYQTPVSAEGGFIWLLLEKSGCIPKEFSEQQRHDISDKITSALQDKKEQELARLNTFTDQLLSMVKHYPV